MKCHKGGGFFEYWMVSRAAPMSKFLVCRSLVSQPPSSEKPIDSMWESDSMSRGSASARERNESHEAGPKCDSQAAYPVQPAGT